jgi:4-amino-4-deoxy-L-arabinose transferase-like glycosyltransferase
MKRLVPALSILVFFLAGLALIPYPGLQNDELFFSGPIFASNAAFYNIEIGAMKIPVMVMSYTGALKTWLYQGLFAFLAPTEWSVRIPVLLMGMGTIWLTWVWVRRLAGERAAAIAAILLSTDALFQLTNTFDWGPVALQHVLLMGGLLAFDSWLRSDSKRFLALACFLWGLGLWDKALLIWPLAGLGVAALCIYPRETLRRVRPKAAGIALAALLIGAAPLVWYNIDRHGETATANTRLTVERLDHKVAVLTQTVNGSALFGYMVYRTAPGYEVRPRNAVGRVSAWVGSVAGDHHRNPMLSGYLAALLAFAALWRDRRRRFLGFLLIACLVTWAQMAFNRATGDASHHVILIWPFPVVFAGIAFSALAERLPRYGPMILAGFIAVLATGNLLNENEYLRAFAVNGAFGGWTDALYPLANSVEKSPDSSWYGIVDWGYLNGLRLLHEGDLPVFLALVPTEGTAPTEADRAEILREIEDPTHVFIEHTDDQQMFPGINTRWRDAAAQLGYSEKIDKTIHDRNGRPVFELLRFEKRQ